MRKLWAVLLTIVVVSSLVFLSGMHFGETQTVKGTIVSDTSWTKANSPYSLTGPVLVSQGVTLTIEPGATVNLNEYCIIVNGTLIAKGTSNDTIQINGADGSPLGIPLGSSSVISFTYGITINNFNQYRSGSEFENVFINSVRIALGSSGNVNNCTINGFISAGDSSIISNNLVTGVILAGGASKVLNNHISGGVEAEYGSPVIANNVISGSIRGDGIWCYLAHDFAIYDNSITGCNEGIFVQGGNGVIDRNYIANNNIGVNIACGARAGIQVSTIENNQVGFQVASDVSEVVSYCNFQNNSYNIYLKSTANITAPNNWWGSPDPKSINETIHDFKNDFNLGKVNFNAFLTAPNPDAPTILSAGSSHFPTPIPTPSQNPIPTFSLSPTENSDPILGENTQWIIFGVSTVAIVALLFTVAELLHKRNISRSQISETQK